MSRARVLLTAVCVLALQSLTHSQVMAFERIEIDPTAVLVHTEPQDVEHARSEGPDGSIVIGGHLGAEPGCPGVQAFAKKKLDGDVVWSLSASADKDCDLDGQPDGGGDAMFDDITGLDPAFILASTAYDTVNLPDMASYVTGQYLVAWNDGGELTAVWAAYVLYLSPEGDYLADRYVGPQPPPTALPVSVATGDAICAALGDVSLTQWGGRALAPVENETTGAIDGVVLAGWRRASGDQGQDKNIFLVALTADLSEAKWFRLFPYQGTDQPLDVAVAVNDDVYVTGYFGPEHDVFVACFDGLDGTLTYLFTGGGSLDDWGEEIAITANGEIEIKGKFTDTATFADQTLQGEGLTDFRALLTPELELILIEAPNEESFGGSNGAPLKDLVGIPNQVPANPGGPYSNVPNRVVVLVGEAGTGAHASLVQSPDDRYLSLRGEDRPDHKKVEVVFEVPIFQGAPRLKSVKLQLTSFYCTNLTVLVGGGDAILDHFYEIGDTEICPLDEPAITFDIPSDIAEDELGFTASSFPFLPLKILLSMEIHGVDPCSTCVGPGEDESVNSAEAMSDEFP